MATTKKNRTQYDDILHHLKTHKGITTYEAINKYGAIRLSAVIFQIRKNGYKVINVYHSGVDCRGNKMRWVEYRLVKEEKR